MTLAIASMFRDSQQWHGHPINQVDKFFGNWEGRAREAGLTTSYHLVEGNSVDDTRGALERWAADLGRVHLYTHLVEGSRVESLASARRFQNLAATANVALRAARAAAAEFVLWTESDLVPAAGLLAGLADALRRHPDALGVAPVPRNGGEFYDTWAFEGPAGERWAKNGLGALAGRGVVEMRSVGSCFLMWGDALRVHNLDFGTGCFPALCSAARAAGLTILCDTNLFIDHPNSRLVASRLI